MITIIYIYIYIIIYTYVLCLMCFINPDREIWISSDPNDNLLLQPSLFVPSGKLT